MGIMDIKFNGIVEPIGYLFQPLIVSWSVDNGLGKMQKEAAIQVAADQEFKEIALERNGDLDSSGETLTLQFFGINMTEIGDGVRRNTSIKVSLPN